MLSHHIYVIPWHFSTKAARKNSIHSGSGYFDFLSHKLVSSLCVFYFNQIWKEKINLCRSSATHSTTENSAEFHIVPIRPSSLTQIDYFKYTCLLSKKNCHLNILREYTKYVRTEESNKKNEKKNMKSHHFQTQQKHKKPVKNISYMS